MKIAGVLLSLLPPLVTGAWAALGPRYGGELRIGVSAVPSSIEPAAPTRLSERLVGALVHETLVRIGSDGVLSPGLAERWASASEGREWRLTLAPGLTFHDGRPITPEDAVRSIRRFLRSSSAVAAVLARSLEGGVAFRAGTTDQLAGVSAASERREILLRFLSSMATPLAPLASPAAAVVGPTGAGCGPFLPTVRIPGRSLSLTAFGGHVRGRPFADRVHIQSAAEGDPADFDVIAGEPGVSALAGVLLLVLDPTKAPFDQAATRAAVAAAIDRGEIARLTPGADAAATLLPAGLLPPLASLPPSTAAGPPGAGARDLVLAVDRTLRPLLSQRVVAHLRALGFNTQAVPVEPAAALVAPAQARLLLFVPEVAEAGLALHELLGLFPQDAAVADALEHAFSERDLDRRRAFLYRAEEACLARAVVIPLGILPLTASPRPEVHGVSVDPAGRILLENAWLQP